MFFARGYAGAKREMILLLGRLGPMITETAIIDDTHSAVSWKAILAGATASLALMLLLMAFAIGVGFSVVSPWADQGISSTTFTLAAGVYLIVIAMLSSTVGGYLAGRLRSQWRTVHEHERYFRDSAHGFVVWALATIVSAGLLGGAFTHVLAGASGGLAPAATAAAQGSPTDIYIDTLLRPAAATSAQAATPTGQMTSPAAEGQTASPLQGGQITTPATAADPSGNVRRGEITRILAPSLHKGGSVSEPDKTYLARVVSARTGLPQADAEQRVNQAITQAKADADAARKSAAKFSLWLVVSMLAGALSASLAAIEGGNLRNREWYLTESERGRIVAAE
jgi:hypothetical protein